MKTLLFQLGFKLLIYLAERYGKKLFDKLSDVLEINEDVRAIADFAFGEVLKLDELNPDAAGEFKRHQLYALLLKRFPESTKKDIALAIEIAVREVAEWRKGK